MSAGPIKGATHYTNKQCMADGGPAVGAFDLGSLAPTTGRATRAPPPNPSGGGNSPKPKVSSDPPVQPVSLNINPLTPTKTPKPKAAPWSGANSPKPKVSAAGPTQTVPKPENLTAAGVGKPTPKADPAIKIGTASFWNGNKPAPQNLLNGAKPKVDKSTPNNPSGKPKPKPKPKAKAVVATTMSAPAKPAAAKVPWYGVKPITGAPAPTKAKMSQGKQGR